MSTYTRDFPGFKGTLACRRDEQVLACLQAQSPELAASFLYSARMHLHSQTYTEGDLDAIVILFWAETAIRLENSQL